jgi:hypothetical protein
MSAEREWLAPVPDRPANLALTIDEAIIDFQRIEVYLGKADAFLNDLRAKRNDLRALIADRMATTDALVYNGEFGFAEYQKIGRISPEVLSPEILRKTLLELKRDDGKTALIPESWIDDAIPVVTPAPFVKPNVTKLKGLRKFGKAACALLDLYIRPGEDKVQLVVSPLVTDVTPR